MILGDVEETVTSVEIDDETYEEIVRVSILTSQFFFVQLNVLAAYSGVKLDFEVYTSIIFVVCHGKKMQYFDLH